MEFERQSRKAGVPILFLGQHLQTHNLVLLLMQDKGDSLR